MLQLGRRAALASICLLNASLLTACGAKSKSYRGDTTTAAPANPDASYARQAYAGGAAPYAEPHNTERYDRIVENDFRSVKSHPLSTFSIDVDTASYSNVRRFLRAKRLPPKGAVRIEELINYFDYAYSEPKAGKPFSVTTEVGPAPWNPKHQLVHIGLRGRSIKAGKLPARNLVFLLDVSGSMSSPNKLPLLKRAFSMLVDQLRAADHVSIVVYAGAAGVVLPPTPGDQRATILGALDRLSAGGSTNGGQGIHLAYAMAAKHFDANAINRVILATDGDFNVGTTNQSELIRLIEAKRKSGVFLTVLGFGSGNLNDSTMEKLADKGNGNYAYIDSVAEARKVLVTQAGATLVTIAKDVKIQVELNPAKVQSYRLIGYENRILDKSDFNDDKKDAGEIGAGHTVTAIYEVVPAGAAPTKPGVDPLKYQTERSTTAAATGSELMTIKLRYKAPKADKSTLMVTPVTGRQVGIDDTSTDFRFSAAVAAFGMLLRDSKHKGAASWPMTAKLARSGAGADANGYRAEFLTLIDAARRLAGPAASVAR